MASVADLLNAARGELGYTEDPPNSNQTKFAAEAGHPNGEPWCVTFEIALAKRIGLILPPGVAETAYTWTALAIFRDAKASPIEPLPGDWAYFNIGQGHTGIVETVQYSTITTIDGNTIPEGQTGDQANGGEVCRKTRSKQIVAGYGRPTYSTIGAPFMNLGPRTTVRILHVQHWGHEPTPKDLDFWAYLLGQAGDDDVKQDEIVASIYDRESK